LCLLLGWLGPSRVKTVGVEHWHKGND
jgi:hypothetical protein